MGPNEYYSGGQAHYFGGGGDTNIHPLILCFVILAAVLIVFLRRKYTIYPFLLAATLVPFGQFVVIGGLHFEALRILVLGGWLRVITSRYLTHSEVPLGPLTSIDKAFALWTLSNAVMFTILWSQWGALVNRLGFLLTYLGGYLLLRFLIRDNEEVERTIKALAFAALVFGVLMLNEQLTGRNLFGMFGGISQIATIREGRIRSQAGFPHPLMAGGFGATVLLLCIALWLRNRKAWKAATMGMAGGVLMAITSWSSTPVIAIAAGIFALCLWPLRRNMRLIRWGIVTTLVGLHMSMKAPVWALIARMDLVGGSSGYHRFELIDQAVRHFWDWWLVGTTTQSQWGWDMWDSINWYVNEGTSGGLLTLTFFVLVIVYGFKRIGAARKEAAAEGNHRREAFMWALGATLFSCAVAFLGIDYYGQATVMWLAFLVMISTATAPPKRSPEVATQHTFVAPTPQLLSQYNE